MGSTDTEARLQDGDLGARLDELERMVRRLMGAADNLPPASTSLRPLAAAWHHEGREQVEGVARPPSGSVARPPFDGRYSNAVPTGFNGGRAKLVRKLLRKRRQRDQYFPSDLFADPAWDMMLDLYAAHYERREISVSSLCIAAAVPATTALRWIKTMVDEGRFIRVADPDDGRRIIVSLSDDTRGRLDEYFDDFED